MGILVAKLRIGKDNVFSEGMGEGKQRKGL